MASDNPGAVQCDLPGPDIFLSYNHEDAAAVAKTFAYAFAREGFEMPGQ